MTTDVQSATVRPTMWTRAYRWVQVLDEVFDHHPVSDLQATVHRLERRVVELEARETKRHIR